MRSMKRVIRGARGWAVRTVILALLFTGTFLVAPPTAKAGLLFYDITTTAQGGSLDGQTIHAFFSYDTNGDPASQASPAGIASPQAVAATNNQAEINVAALGGGGSTLQVEAYLPPGNTFILTGTFSQPFTFNNQLPIATLVNGMIDLTDGPTSFTAVFQASNIVQRPAAVPEPSTLVLLFFGGLAGSGFHRWRQRRERALDEIA